MSTKNGYGSIKKEYIAKTLSKLTNPLKRIFWRNNVAYKH